MTRQSFIVGIAIFKRLVSSMEKDFCHKYQLWKLFRRIRNQTAAHAQKGVKCPLIKKKSLLTRYKDIRLQNADKLNISSNNAKYLWKNNSIATSHTSQQKYYETIESIIVKCLWGIPKQYLIHQHRHHYCHQSSSSSTVKRADIAWCCPIKFSCLSKESFFKCQPII